MCVILHLEAGASIDSDKLANAVYNNPHGWGLIVLGEDFQDGIYVEHHLEDDKETKPDDVIELLTRYKDHERVLHLRWATVGKVTKENLHPFKIYSEVNDETGVNEEAWFMHNGTLSGYGSDRNSYYGTYSCVTEEWYGCDEDISDSKDFAIQILEPYMERWDGDYTDYHFRKLINEFWTGMSRGVIVSNYMEIWRFGGKWEELDANSAIGKVYASNDTYFDRVQRGPEHERRAEVARKAAAEKRAKELAEGKIAPAKNFLSVIDWKSIDNPRINHERLIEVGRDLPVDIRPGEVFEICKSLTNDELASVLMADYKDMQAGDFDPESSFTFSLIYAYNYYFPLLIAEVESHTGKTCRELVDARANA